MRIDLYVCCWIYSVAMYFLIFFLNMVGEVLEASVEQNEVKVQYNSFLPWFIQLIWHLHLEYLLACYPRTEESTSQIINWRREINSSTLNVCFKISHNQLMIQFWPLNEVQTLLYTVIENDLLTVVLALFMFCDMYV